MSDSKETPKLEDFKGILSWLEKKKTTDTKSGSPWGWITGLIAAAIAFFSIAIFTYKAWKKGREVAALKHRLDVMKEEKERNKADKVLQKEASDRAKIDESIELVQNIIDNTKEEMKIAKEEHNKAVEKIKAIKSWDEVDKL
jgi:hypothetical protein